MPLLLDTAHLGLSEGIIKASSSSSPPFIFLSPLSFLFFKLSLLFPPFISQYGELLITDHKHTHAHYLLVKINHTHTGFNKVHHSCIQQLLTLSWLFCSSPTLSSLLLDENDFTARPSWHWEQGRSCLSTVTDNHQPPHTLTHWHTHTLCPSHSLHL